VICPHCIGSILTGYHLGHSYAALDRGFRGKDQACLVDRSCQGKFGDRPARLGK